MANESRIICTTTTWSPGATRPNVDAITIDSSSNDSDDGAGAASTGSNPRTMRDWRATERPSKRHVMPSEERRGITSATIGVGGRYLAPRWAACPDWV